MIVHPKQYLSLDAYKENRFSSDYNLKTRITTKDRNVVVWAESFKITLNHDITINNRINISPGVCFINDVLVHITQNTIIDLNKADGYLLGDEALPAISRNAVYDHEYFFLVLQFKQTRGTPKFAEYKLISSTRFNELYNPKIHLLLAKIIINTDLDSRVTSISSIFSYLLVHGVYDERFEGLDDSYIPISTIEELQSIGTSSDFPSSGNYFLVNDIDATITETWNNGDGFKPINLINCTFNGMGFKIINLFLKTRIADISPFGIFSTIDGVMIKNLFVENIHLGITYESKFTHTKRTIGCLAGMAVNSIILDTYVEGEVVSDMYDGLVAEDWELAGIVGRSTGNTIARCYTDVTMVDNAATYTGGICGRSYSTTIQNCYSESIITGLNAPGLSSLLDAAGISGLIFDGSVIDSCYNAGEISGAVICAAITGDAAVGCTVTNCYYDSDISGVVIPNYGTPKTTIQMKDDDTFVDWDFDNVWLIGEDGIDYPRLRFINYLLTEGLLIEITYYYRIILELYRSRINNLVNGGVVKKYDSDLERPFQILDPINNMGWFEDWNAIEISNEEQLRLIGVDYSYPLYGSYVLTNDIYLTRNFTPIGTQSQPFRGRFNGDGFSIYGESIGNTDARFQGLFGYTIGADIFNVGLDNLTVYGNHWVGGIVGLGYSTNVYKCYTGSGVKIVTSERLLDEGNSLIENTFNYTGSIIGGARNSNVRECYSFSTIESYNCIGGITGELINSNMSDCYFIGNIKGEGNYVGGLIGQMSSLFNNTPCTFANCYTIITGGYFSGEQCGGLIGRVTSDVLPPPTTVFSNNYWNTDRWINYTEKELNSLGIHGALVQVSSSSLSDLRSASNFNDWNFATIWEIRNLDTYPYLIRVTRELDKWR